MNYTHYWYYPVIADMTEINNVINEVKKLEKILNLVMKYNNSDGIIDNKNIYFNKMLKIGSYNIFMWEFGFETIRDALVDMNCDIIALQVKSVLLVFKIFA